MTQYQLSYSIFFISRYWHWQIFIFSKGGPSRQIITCANYCLGCTKVLVVIKSLLQFWVWHLSLIWLWLKFVLGVCFESIGRYLSEKNWFLNAILRLQIFAMTREAEVEMLKNLLFCINKPWTENMKKFESSENHFVPNVLSVKNLEYNPCMIFLSDPPL